MPARAYWQGQIRLALVSIPVEVYAATKSGATIAFHQIHEPSGKRINYEKIVQGIGPAMRRVLDLSREAGGKPAPTDLVRQAHDLGLVVHPYTLRVDALPQGVASAETLHEALFLDAGADGVFSDFPDVTRQWLKARSL